MNYWVMRKREDNGEKLEFKNEKEEYWYNYMKKSSLLVPFGFMFFPILIFFLVIFSITYNWDNYIIGIIISSVIVGFVSIILTIINIYIYKRVYTRKLRYEISFYFVVGLSWSLVLINIVSFTSYITNLGFTVLFYIILGLGIGYGCVMSWLVYNKKYKKLKEEN